MKRHEQLESLAHGLVRRAALRAPPELSRRLEEEWLADLSARHGLLTRLMFAAGCHWAARTIALEFGVPARVAAAAGTSRSATVALNEQPARSSSSQRFFFLLMIVGLHAALIYGLAVVVPPGQLAKIPERMVAVFLPSAKIEDSMPQPSPRESTPTRVHVSLPVITFQAPSVSFDEPPIDAGVPVSGEPIADPIATTLAVHRINGGPGAGFPSAEDYYPSAAIRMELEGVTTVQVCVNESGRLTGTPSVAESSGSTLLDKGALELARAGSGKYRATTENGRTISSCYPFRVRFQLKR